MITYKSFFFIGIKGVMMANLAVMLKKMGHQVTGTDIKEEFITDYLLQKENIQYSTGFSLEILPASVNCIVYAASHGGANNPLIIEAKKRKINVVHQAELLGELIKDFKTKIAICGCHGKTTTSSLLSFALIQLDQQPSYCVGVPYFGLIQGGNYLSNKYFVVEADEYGVNPPFDKTPKFHFLNPDYVICTNIDFDHPDVYHNLKETKQAFMKFFDNKKLILSIDDPTISQIIGQLKNKVLTYGYHAKAQYQIRNVKTTNINSQFEILNNVLGQLIGIFSISLFGEKNISNATAVIVMLLELGFDYQKIMIAIKGFKGAERRFEELYNNREIRIFDDYAHHPNEIRATIDAARKRFPENRLIIIFQPHTYSRTQALLKEFSFSLSKADLVYILPIFASVRENKEHFSVTSEDIAKQSSKSNLIPVKDKVQSIELLSKEIKSNDIIITMGAGDVYKLKDDIIKIVNQI